MKITEEEKKTLVNTLRELQKTHLRVYLDTLKEAAPVSKWKFAKAIAALQAEGRIRIGGIQKFRWCVADEPDKEGHILTHLSRDDDGAMDTLRTITGLADTDIVDMCLRLHREGRIVITGVSVMDRSLYEHSIRDDDGTGAATIEAVTDRGAQAE